MAKKSKTMSALVPITQGSLPDFGYAKYADHMAKQRASTPLTVGMPRIKSGQGLFLLPGSQVGSKTFDAVVLCALRANRWNSTAYDPKNPSPPDCVAMARLGQNENEMAPNQEWPKVQSDTCLTCRHNVRGGQKACRNGIDLALVAANDEETIDWKTAIVAVHTISSTGIQPWGKVVGFLEEKKIPLFAAVMRFQSLQLDGKSYYTTVATPVATVQPEAADVIFARVSEAERDLLASAEPFIVSEQEAAPPPARRKVAAKGGSRRSL